MAEITLDAVISAQTAAQTARDKSEQADKDVLSATRRADRCRLAWQAAAKAAADTKAAFEKAPKK